MNIDIVTNIRICEHVYVIYKSWQHLLYESIKWNSVPVRHVASWHVAKGIPLRVSCLPTIKLYVTSHGIFDTGELR